MVVTISDKDCISIFKAGRTSSRKSATPLSTTAKKNAKRVQVSEKEKEAAAPAQPVDTPPDSTVETEEQFHAKVSCHQLRN